MQTCSGYVCWPAGHITQDAVIEEDVLLAIGVDLQGGDAGGVVVHHHDTGAVEPLGLVHEQVAPLIVHVICNDKALWKVEIRFELIYTINARESWFVFFCNLKTKHGFLPVFLPGNGTSMSAWSISISWAVFDPGAAHMSRICIETLFKLWCHFIVTNTDSCGRTISSRSLKDIWQSVVSANQLFLSCVFPSDWLPSKTAFVAELNTDFSCLVPQRNRLQLSCLAFLLVTVSLLLWRSPVSKRTNVTRTRSGWRTGSCADTLS